MSVDVTRPLRRRRKDRHSKKKRTEKSRNENGLTMPPEMWTRSLVPLSLVTASFLAELPWVLLSDISGVLREFHGFTVLRVAAASVFGSSKTSLNVFGWLVDFDKIFPWLITLFVLVRLRALLRKGFAMGCQRLGTRFPRWVTAAGILGAVLIFGHYVTSDSGHFSDYQDKGLFDAMRHLLSDGLSMGWSGILGYRLTYLSLAPVLYFLMFAAVGCALVAADRLLHKHHALDGRSPEAVSLAARFLILASVPGLALCLLHFGAASAFGWANFWPSRGRLLIVLVLACTSILGPVAVVLRTSRVDAKTGSPLESSPLPRSLVHAGWAVVQGFRKSVAGTLALVAWAISVTVPGYLIWKAPVTSSVLNLAINRSADFYVVDTEHVPERAARYDDLLDWAVRDLPDSAVASQGMKSADDAEARALVLATAVLLDLGLSPLEIGDLSNSGVNGVRTLQAVLSARDAGRFAALTESASGRARLERSCRRFLHAWHLAVRAAPFSYKPSTATMVRFAVAVSVGMPRD